MMIKGQFLARRNIASHYKGVQHVPNMCKIEASLAIR